MANIAGAGSEPTTYADTLRKLILLNPTDKTAEHVANDTTGTYDNLKSLLTQQPKTYTEADLSGGEVQNEPTQGDYLKQKTTQPPTTQPTTTQTTQPVTTQTTQDTNVSTLKDAVVNQQPPQTYSQSSYTPVKDNSGMINSQYDSLVSALKAKIQQSMNDKHMQINGLGQKYQPQRNQSEVQRGNDLRTALEQAINAGDRGGIGRQNALETQTSADNRLNNIDLQQQGELASLQNDINNLALEGNVQEAQYKAQQLKDLITNSQYVDETNYNRMTNADNTNYSRLRDALSDKRYDTQYADQRGDVLYSRNYQTGRDAIGDARYNKEYADQRGDVQYNRDYQAGRDAINDSRYTREYSDKMMQQDFENTMAQNQFDEAKAQNAFVRQMQEKGFTADESQRKWERGMQTRQFEESIRQNKLAQSNWQKEMTFKQAQAAIDNAVSQGRLGQDAAQLALQQAKFAADQDPNSLDNQYKRAQIDNIKNKGVDYDFNKDPDYADDYQYAVTSKNSEQILTDKAADFIKKYGTEGYQTLLKAARGE